MKQFIKHNAGPLFYAGWFLLHLLQALFTELQDDEAYYWVYAHYLDWGYFDHPPMIALLIKWGGWLFGKELGIRFFPLVLNTLTLLLTETLIKDKNKNLFYAVCLSAAVLQVIGFWAVPDVPLLFFTAFFFWCYKRFISHTSLPNTLLLAVACALLMYTKYHGALIILFTILSNLQLLRRWPIYVAGLVALLLFLPHLWWQYQHDWISFRYHLFESNVNTYKLSYTTEYIAGQLLIAGPLAGVIFLWATFKYAPKDALEKALKYTAIGIFAFFFLSTFKGKVEANWTAPAIIPMLVLTHQFVKARAGWRKWLYRLLTPTLVIVFIFRIIMAVNFIPAKAIIKRFHTWEGWPRQIAAVTGDYPIVFKNSYQRASKIWFYTGKPAYSLSTYNERRSNYNYWPVEDSLLGKTVYLMDIYNLHEYPDSVKGTLWNVGYRLHPNFLSFTKVMLVPEKGTYTINENEKLVMRLQVQLPEHYKQFLKNNPAVNMPVKIGVFQKREWVKDIPLTTTLQDMIRNPRLQLTINHGLPKGAYFIRIAIGASTGGFTHNSDKINVEVR